MADVLAIDTEAMTEARQAIVEAEQAKWLTIREVAAVLRISVNTVCRMIHEGQIKTLRSGKSIRVHVEDLRQAGRAEAS